MNGKKTPMKIRDERRGAVRRLAASLCVALLGAGCAATGPMTMVDDEDRDTPGAYDGAYRLRLAERPRGFQNVGTWQMRCATNGFDIPMTVEDGTARLRTRFTGAADPRAPVVSFVSRDGGFRFEVPLASRAEATGTSSSTLDNGAMKLIYQGDLAESGDSRGLYTVGIAEFGYAGCAYGFEVVPGA